MNGYVYIAYGRGHLAEAEESASRLKEIDSNNPVRLITNKPYHTLIFDDVKIENLNTNYLSGKVDMLGRHSYDKTIYLDTDTWFVDSPANLFNELNNYDILICPDPAEVPIPETELVPYNTGVIGVSENQNTKNLFEIFRKYYYTFSSNFISYHPLQKKTDQPYFMMALRDSLVKVLVLNSVWNMRYRFYTDLCGSVHIIHGPKPNIGWNSLSCKINYFTGNRVWDPKKMRLISSV